MLDIKVLSTAELNQLEQLIKKEKEERLSKAKLRENDDLIQEYLKNFDSKNTKRIYNHPLRNLFRLWEIKTYKLRKN